MAGPLDRLPDPRRLLRPVDPPEEPGPDAPDEGAGTTLIGGRHGSPNIVLGLPFSSVRFVEADRDWAEPVQALAQVVEDLAALAARLAASTEDEALRADADALAAAEVRAQVAALATPPA